MIRIENLSKSFGTQTLFDDANLALNKGERLGLVGRNGHGKSTLFKMIIGEEQQDEGDILWPKKYSHGHLEQHFNFTEENVLAEVDAILPMQEGDWKETYKAEAVLGGLGFTQENLKQHANEFSGGWQIRINLAKLLLTEPDMLLLDEPTNYLDILSIRWLINYLKNWPRELIIITHDKYFMDAVCTHTCAIHRKKFRKIEGPVDKLWSTIFEEEELHQRAVAGQQKKREHMESFVKRFGAKASKAAAARSRVKALDKMEVLEDLSNIASLGFKFKEAPFSGKRMLDVENLAYGWPGKEILFKDLDMIVNPGDRVAVVGANGKGKSTLLHCLAGELDPVRGEVKRHDNAKLGVFAQTHIQRLSMQDTVEEAIADALPYDERGRARALAGQMMFEGDNSQKKIENLSGGERSRVHLARILAQPANILYLDEPTNHLDHDSTESLIQALEEFSGTLVFVTHSEALLERLATKLIVYQPSGLRFYDGGYKEFLTRFGWESEKDAEVAPVEMVETPKNLKDDRKNRAKSLQEKTKALKPLKQILDKAEKLVEKLEADFEKVQAELLEVSSSGDSQKIQELSIELSSIESHKEDAFEEYEEASMAVEAEEEKWA